MRTPIALACAALAAPLAFAQPAQGPDMQWMGGPMRHDILFMAGAQLDQERVVEGAPYCADALHETVQQLADGNRIVQRQTSRQCRDSQGRTRQEISTPDGRVRVYLRDPVAREAWLLDSERKLAVRLDGHRIAMGANVEPGMWGRVVGWGHEMRDRVKQTFRFGGDALPAGAPPDAPTAALPMPRGPLTMGPGAGMPPPIALHARLLGPRGPGVTTMLPAESIDGLRAEGRRTVWTIEAGKIGNEKPITVVNEVWSSPELGITLKTRDVDPVVGEDSFTVRNVARGEPDAQLFRVPAEFAKATPPQLPMRAKP